MKEFPVIKNMSTIYDNITASYYIIVSLIPFEHFTVQCPDLQVFHFLSAISLSIKSSYYVSMAYYITLLSNLSDL